MQIERKSRLHDQLTAEVVQSGQEGVRWGNKCFRIDYMQFEGQLMCLDLDF